MWPPEKITIELSWDEAVVLYYCLYRYHESRKPELVTDRAEWHALVKLLGALERNGTVEIPDYPDVLAKARRKFADYDPPPF